MEVGENNRLIVDEGDGFTYRFENSPNISPGLKTPKNLIVHATEGPNVQAAVNTFKDVNDGRSIHLILGRDGKEVVQMVEFNVKAVHANEFNRNSLGIELDYTGPLIEDESVKNDFRHISNFNPGEYIYGVALNDQNRIPTRLRPWPRYPKEQMDALVRIARFLVKHYGLQIFGHEEIKSFKLDPGPAFPMFKFKGVVNDKVEGSVVLDETGQDLELRTGPGTIYPLLPGGKLNAGTPVSIASDHNGWALVEVMAEVEGNPWLVGWAQLDSIVAKRATPVVKNHKLFTTNDLQYKFIMPHPNNFDASRKLIEPKYLIMHITGGINMESTINWFRNEDAGVSSHLLIGRDGRVVQFVDFDTIAFHCGFSYWEGDFDLNRYSIGIELDNGAFLSRADGVWKWKTTVIPEEEVMEAQHWKENSKRGWQKFTQVQIEVALQIVQVLQKKYGFKVILGHDVINLKERMDPGPLFPMEDFREKVLGQPGVLINVHQPTEDTPIYNNPNQKPPNVDHPKHNRLLPKKTRIKVLLVKGEWTQIKVVNPGPLKGTEGWIRSSSVNQAQKNPKTKVDSEYYRINPKAPAQAPPSLLKQSPLPAETRLRIQKIEGDWALVAALETVKGHKYLEGWVESGSIQLIGEERIVYPPPFKE